jgi:hypothetical protein
MSYREQLAEPLAHLETMKAWFVWQCALLGGDAKPYYSDTCVVAVSLVTPAQCPKHPRVTRGLLDVGW